LLVQAFHDGLDLVSVHEELVTEFRSVLKSLRGRQSLDAQIEAIANEKAPKLSDTRLFVSTVPLPRRTTDFNGQVFKNLLRQLLQGKSLSMEDTVDTLTLKDNTTTIENYRTALHLLSRDRVCSSSRCIS
jgi:nuclear pore complex protein Nup133